MKRSESKALVVRKAQEIARLKGVTMRDAEWVVADCSGSMATQVAGSQKSRIDCLNEAIRAMDPNVQWIGFSDDAVVNEKREPFEIQGGTNFKAGLDLVDLFQPSYVCFISDGEDNYPEEPVLEICKKIAQSAIIDTLFIGSSNEHIESLLKKMAEIGHGSFSKWDSTKAQQLSLTSVIMGLLPAPASDGAIKL